MIPMCGQTSISWPMTWGSRDGCILVYGGDISMDICHECLFTLRDLGDVIV